MKSKDYEAGRDDQATEDQVSRGRSGPSVALIAFLVVAAYGVAFFFRNSHDTEVDFVFGETDTTLRWSLLVAVGIGILLDRLLSTWWRSVRRRR